MKKLIIILGLFCSMNVFAAETVEPTWKEKLRLFVTQTIGVEWSNKIFGTKAAPAPDFALPEIPQQVKKSTDVSRAC